MVLVGRLREAIRRMNPAIPEDVWDEVLRKLLRVGMPSPMQKPVLSISALRGQYLNMLLNEYAPACGSACDPRRSESRGEVKGMAGFVLANGSMSSNQFGEGDIRRALIEADLVVCKVALPGQIFYRRQIPATRPTFSLN